MRIVHFMRDEDWTPVSIIRKYHRNDLVEMYQWGLENIPNSMWIIAMKKSINRSHLVPGNSMMAEWIFYFPTDEEAMAFKLRWL